jgi:hypothetical protein
MRPRTSVVVTAWTADGFSREIIRADDLQTRMTDGRVGDTLDGLSIDPTEFPGVVRFTVAIRPIVPRG